ncbi:acetyltransferase [Candidatus Methylomirabilis sp.]|uniref:Acetyltransferase n=1 Tax=Candidatus Methylomirabilis tolerans TaxID=3123416 RepID=A0AAJ1AJW2_9BACT|nr:acetyltransferase [Candidatus Methylomirabilis sp.]
MFLKDKQAGHLVEILDLRALFDPLQPVVTGRIHAGEEMQDPTSFNKADLIFPSGECLPRYWVDVHYKDATVATG